MILMLIIPTWILILSLITGLCLAARVGDHEEQRESPPRSTSDRPEAAVVPLQTAAPTARTSYPCNPVAQVGGGGG